MSAPFNDVSLVCLLQLICSLKDKNKSQKSSGQPPCTQKTHKHGVSFFQGPLLNTVLCVLKTPLASPAPNPGSQLLMVQFNCSSLWRLQSISYWCGFERCHQWVWTVWPRTAIPPWFLLAVPAASSTVPFNLLSSKGASRAALGTERCLLTTPTQRALLAMTRWTKMSLTTRAFPEGGC